MNHSYHEGGNATATTPNVTTDWRTSAPEFPSTNHPWQACRAMSSTDYRELLLDLASWANSDVRMNGELKGSGGVELQSSPTTYPTTETGDESITQPAPRGRQASVHARLLQYDG